MWMAWTLVFLLTLGGMAAVCGRVTRAASGGDFAVRDFRFRSSDMLADLSRHWVMPGSPRCDAATGTVHMHGRHGRIISRNCWSWEANQAQTGGSVWHALRIATFTQHLFTLRESRQFLSNSFTQWRQVDLHSVPYLLRGNVFVIMAVNVARAGHIFPCDRRMARLYVVWQPARSLGNDFKATGYRIDCA